MWSAYFRFCFYCLHLMRNLDPTVFLQIQLLPFPFLRSSLRTEKSNLFFLMCRFGESLFHRPYVRKKCRIFGCSKV